MVIFDWGVSLGWGISPGPPLSNYTNIYLYLYVPVCGQEGSAKGQQSYLPYYTSQGSEMQRVDLDCSSPLVVHIFK